MSSFLRKIDYRKLNLTIRSGSIVTRFSLRVLPIETELSGA